MTRIEFDDADLAAAKASRNVLFVFAVETPDRSDPYAETFLRSGILTREQAEELAGLVAMKLKHFKRHG